jgi:DNA-binding NarL/FixJ family response regulator
MAQGLSSILERCASFELAAWCKDVDEVLTCLSSQAVDLVVVEAVAKVTLPVLHDLRRSARNCKIVLWGDPSTEFSYHVMELGIRGILPGDISVEGFITALQAVQADQLWLDQDMVQKFLFTKRVALTPREGQLVSLLAHGLKNKELAHAMGITEGTVKVYLSRLFRKLGVADRFELALYALKNQLGSEPEAAASDEAARPEFLPTGLASLHSLILQTERIPALAFEGAGRGHGALARR